MKLEPRHTRVRLTRCADGAIACRELFTPSLDHLLMAGVLGFPRVLWGCLTDWWRHRRDRFEAVLEPGDGFTEYVQGMMRGQLYAVRPLDVWPGGQVNIDPR